MSTIVKEPMMSSMSPSNKKRPLSIIQENEDDSGDSVGSEHAEKENAEQEVQEKSNGTDAGEPTQEEVIKSPSFKAIKQFFIDKTENHNNSKNKSAPDEKGLKPRRVEAKKKSSLTDAVPSLHRKLVKTKSPESPKGTVITKPPTQPHHNTSSKPPIFTRTSARVVPKPHSVTHTTPSTTHTTTITSSKKLDPTHHSSPCPSPTPTKPTIKPSSTLLAPTAATQAREQALRKSSSFGAADRPRGKTSSHDSAKVTKSNSVGKNTPRKTVVKRNSTGSRDKEMKQSKKLDPKQKDDNILDRSITDSPMSLVSEADSLESTGTDSAISIDTKLTDINSNSVIATDSSCDHLSSETIETKPHLQGEVTATQINSVHSAKILENSSSDVPAPSETTVTQNCESETSGTNSHSIQSSVEDSGTSITSHVPATVDTSFTSEQQVSKEPSVPIPKLNNTNDSPESDEKRNNNLNLNHSSALSRQEERLQMPLSLTLSTSPTISLIPSSPLALSPTLNYIHSPRSPKIMPKFRTSPTLSRKYSIERNNSNSKITSLSGKLASSVSGCNTFPRSMSRECSIDLASGEDSKDGGYLLDKSRLAAASWTTVPGSPLLANIYRSARRGSYFFKRKQSNESLSSLSENETLESNCDDMAPISAADLNKLKETADRLHLTTRRASILSWRQTYVDDTGLPRRPPDLNGGEAADDNLTVERKQKINEALDWLRNELQDMRTQDQALARQLLTIRQDIHQLKLQRCTEEHQDLLDDFKSELEEIEEYSDVLDIPHPIYEDNPLKHIGITRHNMSARRFSAC